MRFWNISRRKLLEGVGLAGAGTLLGGAAKAPGPRALALIGDRYHNADYIRLSLNKVFGELNIPIDYTIDTTPTWAALLKNYQLFLVLRDGMLWPGGYAGPDAYVGYQMDLENKDDFPAAKSVTWMTEAQGQAIKDFVNAGGGFYPLHNSSHISLWLQELSRRDGRRLYRPSAAAPLPGACHRQRPSHHRGHEALHGQ